MFHQIKNSVSYHYSGIIYREQSWECHFHNSFELIFVIDGSLKVTVNNTEISIISEDFLLISPCMAHSIRANEGSDFFIGVFTPDFVADFKSSQSFYRFRADSHLSEYLKKSLIYTKTPSELSLKSCLYAICSAASLATNAGNTLSESSFVLAANEYISENFDRDFKRKEIADALGYEEHYFSELFSKSFGVGLKKYVNVPRIAKARKMLVSTDKNVIDIALECGFSCTRSFNLAFKKLCGKTPCEYRRENK